MFFPILNLILGSISAAISIIAGLIQIRDAIKARSGSSLPQQRLLPQQTRFLWMVITSTLILAVIFFSVGIPSLAQGLNSGSNVSQSPNNGLSSSKTATLIPAPTATSMSTPTPTPNPCSLPKPNPGTVLYQADWSQSTNGWVGGGNWTALNGQLLNAGDGTPPIFAPYHPEDNCITDYAIEAKITMIKYTDKQEASFGLIIRATANKGGYSLSLCAKQHYAFGAIVATCADEGGAEENTYKALLLAGQNFPDGGTLGGQVFKPFLTQHTYRLEAKANTITASIDENSIISPLTDNTYLSGGQVGMWSQNTQLSVESFTIVAV